MKPAALDLFKGLGGATRGLKAAGFFVIGIDNEDYSTMEGYVAPDAFIQADIQEVAKDVRKYLPALQVDFVWASPPCQEFSVSSQPFKRSREKYTKENPPDRSLWDAAVSIAEQLKAILVLENVRGAEKWMGKAAWRYGSYYFWGQNPFEGMKDLIFVPQPFLKENGIMSHRKGFQRSNKTKFGKDSDDQISSIAHKRSPKDGKTFIGNVQAKKPDHFHASGERANQFVGECSRIDGVGKGHSRKEWAARVAMIPEELSTWIGDCFMRNAMEKYQNVPRGTIEKGA